MGKSAAKIRRNIARAAARGETYTPPDPAAKKEEAVGDADGATDGDGAADDAAADAIDDVARDKLLAAARKLEESLSAVEANADGLNSKEKRSAKRKAEAVAAEEVAGCAVDGITTASELMDWYEKNKGGAEGATAAKKGRKRKGGKDREGDESEQMSESDRAKLASARRLRESLAELEKDEGLNAKERRSAKRKAEAIAAEETGGVGAEELLEWYDRVAPKQQASGDGGEDGESKKKIPYILFVGQLAYTTTADMLCEHFQSTLGKTVIPNKECMKVRLLTDPKNPKKSRGMAFVELESPEVMYECLKMHLTHLDGRRINVERSAGGGAASKKARITSFRESQTNYISETMDSILSSFVRNGEIEESELDEGVIALCKRHSATVVEAALKEYVNEKKERKIKKETLGEKEEENLRNPSAFLTHMIGRIAEEGVGNSSKGRKKGESGGGAGRGGGSGRGGGGGGGRGGRGGGPGRGSGAGRGNYGADASVLQKSGADASTGAGGGGRGAGRGGRIAQIFPSMQARGRGRGRGYM